MPTVQCAHIFLGNKTKRHDLNRSWWSQLIVCVLVCARAFPYWARLLRAPENHVGGSIVCSFAWLLFAFVYPTQYWRPSRLFHSALQGVNKPVSRLRIEWKKLERKERWGFGVGQRGRTKTAGKLGKPMFMLSLSLMVESLNELDGSLVLLSKCTVTRNVMEKAQTFLANQSTSYCRNKKSAPEVEGWH